MLRIFPIFGVCLCQMTPNLSRSCRFLFRRLACDEPFVKVTVKKNSKWHISNRMNQLDPIVVDTKESPIITNSHSIYCGNESSKIRMGNSFPPYLCRRQHLPAAASDTRTEQKKPINRFFTTMMNTAVRRVVSNASRRANATRREFSALFVGSSIDALNISL